MPLVPYEGDDEDPFTPLPMGSHPGRGKRILTRIGLFDKFMGGGLRPRRVTIIWGRTSAGKSRLCTQIAYGVRVRTLWGTGEEEDELVDERALEMGLHVNPRVLRKNTTDVDQIFDWAEDAERRPRLVILDSWQRLDSLEVDGKRGFLKQMEYVYARAYDYAKTYDAHVILLSHEDRDGTFKGNPSLIHDVEGAVFHMVRTKGAKRVLKVYKTRVCPEGSIGFAFRTGGVLHPLYVADAEGKVLEYAAGEEPSAAPKDPTEPPPPNKIPPLTPTTPPRKGKLFSIHTGREIVPA